MNITNDSSQTSSDTRGEDWFIKQVEAGCPQISFPEEWTQEERTVSGSAFSLAIRKADIHFALLVENAIVDGPVDAGYVSIGRPLVFEECVFKHSVLFAGSTLGNLVFVGCVIEGDLLLQGARVRSLHCTPARILDKRIGKSIPKPTKILGKFDLNSAVIEQTLRTNQTLFHSEVDLIRTQIGVDLQIRCAVFYSEENTFWASAAKIKGSADFFRSVFKGPVKLGGISVGGELKLEECQFVNRKHQVVMERATVSRTLLMRNAVFNGGLNMSGAESLKGCVANGATFHEEAMFNWARMSMLVNFREAVFKGNALFRECELSKTVIFAGATFEGELDLYGTAIDGSFNMFIDPGASDDDCPKETTLPQSIDLRGFDYLLTDIGDTDRWRELVKTPTSSRSFDPHPFLVLEKALRKVGEAKTADDVRYVMGLTENRVLHKLRRARWFINSLHRITVGYGVRGYYLFYWLLVAFIAAYIFAAWLTSIGIEAAFYGVDFVIPIDLGWVASLCLSGPERILATLLRIVGWILVPLTLAQLAGFLKPKGD